MKKVVLVFTSFFLTMFASAQNLKIDASRADSIPAAKSDFLVAFFSATGNTRKVAQDLAVAASADIWEIEPLKPYSEEDLDWRNKKSRSSIEMNDPDERPTIKMCTDIRSYKVIFLGFPIWWGICPRIINSWIENNDLIGKIIIPFATSGSSQIAPATNYLRKTYPNYKFKDGRLLNSYPEGFLKLWSKQQIDGAGN